MTPRDPDIDDFFGDDDEAPPVVDTRADGRLYRVPLSRLTANLVNPRTEFGTEDQLLDLGKSLTRRQNQPCPVVSRSAYLKLWPEHADRIGDIDYVLVSGERRFRAASLVGLPALDCVANDDFAVDRKTFMEAVVSENVDRQNFDPVEEAYAVQALVKEFGSNRAVAQHFERADGWVTQRVHLTHLAPALQQLVRTKALPLEPARTLGKLTRDEKWDEARQLAWWEEEKERRAATSAGRRAARGAAPARPVEQPSFTAVKPAPAPTPVPDAGPGPGPGPQPLEQTTTPVATPALERQPEPAAASPRATPVAGQVPEAPVPEPRQQTAEEGPSVVGVPVAPEVAPKPWSFPYEHPGEAAYLLHKKQPREKFMATLRSMTKAAMRDYPDDFAELLSECSVGVETEA